MILANILRRVRSMLGERRASAAVDNVGAGVGEWPVRAMVAVGFMSGLQLGERVRVADIGCGRQTLRRFLPTSWTYLPYDALERTPDTQVCDLDRAWPTIQADLACMLGVLEYLQHPGEVITDLVRAAPWSVISYCHDAGAEQRARQGWRNCLSPQAIEQAVCAAGGCIERRRALQGAEVVYLLRGAVAGAPLHTAAERATLLSAASGGDNAGDAIIEDAVRRLTGLNSQLRLPLTEKMGDDAIAAINDGGRLIVCGTNLYQRVFAGNLTSDVIRRITVPITLLGIGSSDVMGGIPKMDRAGVRAVRMLHERVDQSSVRDEASWRFLKSIGVDNAVVTGCPVLFHGLRRPDFSVPSTGPITMTMRARLLHVDATWDAWQTRLLTAIATHVVPTLVLQSPYDRPIADRLRRECGCMVFEDPWWQAPAYVALARAQSCTVGLRLHFSMLSLAYGRPAVLVSHDSRSQEFCALMGLPVLRLDQADPGEVIRALERRDGDWAGFTARWDALSARMQDFLAAEGLPCKLRA